MLNQAQTITSQVHGGLNPSQKFEKILISTPLQHKYYNNLTFQQTQQQLSTQLQKLLKSSFFTQLTIHLGSQNLSNRSLIQQTYKRQQQILKLKIQQTKKNIRKVSKSQDQFMFDQAMKQYQQSINIIKQREQQVEFDDFVPVIYVEAKRKRPIYGYLNQEFNRKGAGMLNAQVGYRAPFNKLDTLEFKFQTPITSLRRKYYNFDLQWTNPSFYYIGKLNTKLSLFNDSLYKSIDEKGYLFNIGIDKPQHNISIQWQNRVRNPLINQKYDQYIMKNYHLPSFKSSFKINKVWKNTIQFNDINMGQYLQSKGEITVPFISKSQFLKFQVNYRRFYDILSMKKYFNNQLINKLLYSSSIQTNFSFNILKPFRTKYVSDLLQPMQIRGFEQKSQPIQSYSNCKLSAKWNIHNYPLISEARIIPFLYIQSGLSIVGDGIQEKYNKNYYGKKIYGLGSMGLGVAYYVNPFAQIQLIYSLLNVQNLARRQPSAFQIRIGIFD